MNFNDFINSQIRIIRESDMNADDIINGVDEADKIGTNVIFLDIDGVLVNKDPNHTDKTYHIIPEKVEVIKQICQKVNAKIVINSSWIWENVGGSTRAKIAGASHSLRSRIPEVKRMLADVLFPGDGFIVKPIDLEAVYPGRFNFDENGDPVSVNRVSPKGKQYTQPFAGLVLKPDVIEQWLDEHAGEYDKFVIVDDCKDSVFKYADKRLAHKQEMIDAFVQIEGGTITPQDGNVIAQRLNGGLIDNPEDDDMDIEVSETQY